MASEEAPKPGTVTSASDSPVVLDGIVSSEKLGELRALQTEYPALDFKATINLAEKGELLELVKDVGAMQVRGGYIVIGTDDSGVPTGGLDSADLDLFDEARLAPKMRKYLPPSLVLRTNVLEVDGHSVALIFVGRNPTGCAFFTADGTYQKNNREKVVFRKGDVFWRDGTSSVRMTQEGLEEVIKGRIADEKEQWLAEHQQARQREQGELAQAYKSRERADAPLGTVNFDLSGSELSAAVLEMIRANDTVGIQHLFLDGSSRARAAIAGGDMDSLADVLDKLACLGGTFLAYGQPELFERVVSALRDIYSMPLGEYDAERFGFASHINPAELAPRIWLLVMERVFGLGALAVRLQNWPAVRSLTLQKPTRLTDYDANWLRHALTMVARAQHLEKKEDGRTIQLSLLSFARNQVERLACLRPDGLAGDDDAVITSLTQFDVLSNVVAIGNAKDTDDGVFYPNFARFRQSRIQPAVDRLLTDHAMREVLFPGTDKDLAAAFQSIGHVAHHEGFMSDGFDGWAMTPVGAFIEKHHPAEQ